MACSGAMGTRKGKCLADVANEKSIRAFIEHHKSINKMKRRKEKILNIYLLQFFELAMKLVYIHIGIPFTAGVELKLNCLN